MKIKSVLIVAIAMVLVFSSTVPTFAQTDKQGDYIISNEAINFLKDHKVDVTPFEKSSVINDKIYCTENPSIGISKSALYDEDILSFKQQVAAYNFSDDQIQKYIKGLLATTPTIINEAGTDSVTNPPKSTRTDESGFGYEVKSLSGYNEETAFATIPSVYIGDKTSGYLFYSVSSPSSGTWGIDVGLWYGAGGATGDVVGWRGVYNSTTLGQHAVPSDGSIISALTPGKQIYMIGQIRSDGYLECKVLDANNFNTVYLDFIYYVGDHGIYASNGVINRQISLCNGDHTFTNGSYLLNGKFNSAYLYSNTGYAPVNGTNTDANRRGAFGPSGTNGNKVTVNSYTQWDSEDISITYTNP